MALVQFHPSTSYEDFVEGYGLHSGYDILDEVEAYLTDGGRGDSPTRSNSRGLPFSRSLHPRSSGVAHSAHASSAHNPWVVGSSPTRPTVFAQLRGMIIFDS